MTPGRNDLCPCGSGRKYKACCLRQAPSPAETLWKAQNRADADLARALFGHAETALARAAIESAERAFSGGAGDSDLVDREAQGFGPWMLYVWVPPKRLWKEPGRGGAPRTIASDYLARHGSRLDSLTRRYAEACLGEPFSFYAVERSNPGASLDLADLLRGTRHHVLERAGSRDLERGDIIWARVVTLDGLTTISGISSTILAPEAGIEIADLAAKLGRRGPLTPDVLFAKESDVSLLYLVLSELTLNPRLPEMRNTDDEPLAPHRLTFRIEDPARAFAALHTLDLTASREELLREARTGRGGALESVEFGWHKDAEKPGSGRFTILGSLRIDGRKLVVEVNSDGRAKRIRKEIAKRLGTGAVFETAVVSSVEKMLEEAQSRPPEVRARERDASRKEQEEILSDPEVREALARMLEEHYDKWIDEAMPALGGKTPRQAVRSAAGRAKVEALLSGMERAPFLVPGGLGGPAGKIRRKLGLE